MWTLKVRSLLTIAAALAILSDCAAQGSSAISDAPVPWGHSWVAREAATQNLLYVSDLGTSLVDIVTYPGGKLVGKLSGFGAVFGLRVDKSADVFVVDEGGPVQMFAHGGSTPLRKLTTYGAVAIQEQRHWPDLPPKHGTGVVEHTVSLKSGNDVQQFAQQRGAWVLRVHLRCRQRTPIVRAAIS